jgi:predicted RNA binding protein YcfA (HicA-like mRNA interferase family)
MSRQLPTLKPREIIRALNRGGFVMLRVKGSHHYFEHPDRPKLLVCVPYRPRAIKRPSYARSSGNRLDRAPKERLGSTAG